MGQLAYTTGAVLAAAARASRSESAGPSRAIGSGSNMYRWSQSRSTAPIGPSTNDRQLSSFSASPGGLRVAEKNSMGQCTRPGWWGRATSTLFFITIFIAGGVARHAQPARIAGGREEQHGTVHAAGLVGARHLDVFLDHALQRAQTLVRPLIKIGRASCRERV